MPITKKASDTIQTLVESLFSTLKRKYIKPQKSLQFTIVGLQDVYKSAVTSHGGVASAEVADGLSDVASSYIDVTKAKTHAALLQELAASNLEEISSAELESKISKVFETAVLDVQRTMTTEVQRARSVGILEGIGHVSARLDDSDPTVVFITKKDNHVCNECLELHVMSDGRTPKAWRLSEVSSSYHVRGGAMPSYLGLHPHCRCSLTYIPKGYGFRNGSLAYIGEGYDLYEDQRK